MEKIRRIHPSIKKNIRYKLCDKMMEENLITWFSQPQTLQLVQKLINDCKQKNIALRTPNPIFANRLNNSLSNSQIAASHFIPPVSPNSVSLQIFQVEKKNLMTESQVINEERKMTESLTNSLATSMNLSTIPKFYFPELPFEIIAQENILIDNIFKKKMN